MGGKGGQPPCEPVKIHRRYSPGVLKRALDTKRGFTQLSRVKLSKEELLHATKEQLNAIGVVRAWNKGWLTKARLKEWTPEEVKAFWDRAKPEQPDLFDMAPKKEKPLKYRDPLPEQFANALYEKFHRNLS